MKKRFHGEKFAGIGVKSQDQVKTPSGMSGAAPDIPEGASFAFKKVKKPRPVTPTKSHPFA